MLGNGRTANGMGREPTPLLMAEQRQEYGKMTNLHMERNTLQEEG